MRLIVGLALAVALALPWIVPTPVQAGGGGGNACPQSYGLTTYDSYGAELFSNNYYPTLQNSPLRKSASKADKNGDSLVCQKFGGPGPQFVDDSYYIYPYQPYLSLPTLSRPPRPMWPASYRTEHSLGRPASAGLFAVRRVPDILRRN